MRKQLVILATAGLMLTAAVPARADVYTVNPGESIQAAIDVASNGDTINVAPGTYTETLTIAHKGIHIRGAGAGQTILDGTGGSADHLVYVVETDGGPNPLCFSGFTLRNAPLTGSGRFPFRVFMAHDGSTVIAENNTVECADDPDNTWGIYASQCDPGSSIVFQGNTINDCWMNSFLIEKVMGDCEIANNKISQAEDGGSAIYSMSYAIGAEHNDVTGRHYYHDNEIAADGAGGYGVTVASAPWWSGTTHGKYDDLEISHNTIANIADGAQGISLQVGGADGGVVNAVIACNSLSSVAGSDASKGINLDGPVEGTEIRGNSITGFGKGVWFSGQDIGGTELFPTDSEVRWNNIVGNSVYGVLNESTSEIVAAQANWWGDATGPYDNKTLPGVPNYSNPGGLGDEVSSYVDYQNWLSAEYRCPIPEPGALGLMGLGLLSVVRRRRS